MNPGYGRPRASVGGRLRFQFSQIKGNIIVFISIISCEMRYIFIYYHILFLFQILRFYVICFFCFSFFNIMKSSICQCWWLHHKCICPCFVQRKMRAVSGNHHRGNEVMAGEEQDKSCLDGLFINFYQFVIRSFVCRLAGSAVALSYFSLPFFFCLLLLCCSFISVYLSLCLSLCLSVSLSFFYNLCFSFSDLCPSFVFFPQNSRSFEF